MRLRLTIAALTLVGAAALTAGPSFAQQPARDSLRAAPAGGQPSGLQSPKSNAMAGSVSVQQIPKSQMQSAQFSATAAAPTSAGAAK